MGEGVRGQDSELISSRLAPISFYLLINNYRPVQYYQDEQIDFSIFLNLNTI